MKITSFAIASLVSAIATALAAVAFMAIAAQIEAITPPLTSYVRIGLLSIAIFFLGQLIFGTALWRLLAPRHLFRLSMVALAYMLPATLIGLLLADTWLDFRGIFPWTTLAGVAAISYWAAMRHARL
jgi:hypothetical protein